MDNNTCKRIIQFFNDPTDNSNEGKNISKSFDNIVKVINIENQLIKQKELELTLIKQQQENARLFAIQKEEDAKRIANEEKKAKIDMEKLSWKEARNGIRSSRTIDNIIKTTSFTEQENYKVPLNNNVNCDANDNWSNIRSKRENIIKKDAEIYKPGEFRKNNIIPKIKPSLQKEKDLNMIFRQQCEDEIFGLLHKKK